MSVSYLPTYRTTSATRFATELAWFLVLLPPIFFAWHESTFQYDVYLPPDIGNTLVAFTVASVAILGAATWAGSYPKNLVRLAIAYIGLAALHAVLDQIITTDRKLYFFAEAILFALVMIPVITDRQLLHRFIRANFILGITLIALNTVTVLYWLNIVSLPFKQVPRFGSEEGLYELDPLHFGPFGLTENYVIPGNPWGVARLQGFSLEPIHWAYFVFLTVACGLFLLPARRTRRRNWAVALIGTLITVHLAFVFSAVAFISTTVWLGVLITMAIARRSAVLRRHETLVGMLVLVLTPGLIIPFAITQMPNMDLILMADNVLNKGANWESKIGFLTLGSALYTRFLPTMGDPPAAGQNLILSTYLKYGYFLTLPLLAYFWFVLRRAFSEMRFTVMAATSLIIVMHTLVVPPFLFCPTGAMLTLVAAGVAYHIRTAAAIAHAPIASQSL